MYLLFAGDIYYPEGGWADFINYFNTPEDAAAHVDITSPDWWQIVNADTLTVLCMGRGPTGTKTLTTIRQQNKPR